MSVIQYRHFGTGAEVSIRHFGTGAEVSGHFGTVVLVPKCLGSEVSWHLWANSTSTIPVRWFVTHLLGTSINWTTDHFRRSVLTLPYTNKSSNACEALELTLNITVLNAMQTEEKIQNPTNIDIILFLFTSCQWCRVLQSIYNFWFRISALYSVISRTQWIKRTAKDQIINLINHYKW